MNRPTMKDVAAEAHVSHQTVSRVLSTPEVVSPETRERVETAIHNLGYELNDSAAALARRPKPKQDTKR